MRDRLGAGLAAARHGVHRLQAAERLRQGGRVARRGDDVEVLDGVREAPGAAGQLNADRGRVVAQGGHELLGHGQRLREQHARLGTAVRARREGGEQVLLRLRPEALDVLELPALGRMRAAPRSTTRRARRGAGWARFGPSPGMRVISTRPEGMRCFSLSAEGIEPVSSRASIFSAIVLPTPASSTARPCLASSATETPPPGSPWRRSGRPRRGTRPRRPARTGSRAPRRPRLSRRCASPTSLRAALPGAWLILPTYNEAENVEAIVRAALAQLAATGLDHTRPRRGRRLAGRDRRDRRPARRRALGGTRPPPPVEGRPRARLPRGLRARPRERRRPDPRDGRRLLARPGGPPPADRRGRRRRPRARLPLRAGRRRGELGRAPAARLARRLVVLAGAARRSGARPDRRLQVLQQAGARGRGPDGRARGTATASRSS